MLNNSLNHPSTPMAQLRCLSIALALLAIFPCDSTSRSISDLPMSTRHELWMARYGRVYKDDAEKQLRLQIFTDNLQQIESFNNKSDRKYKLGLNKFADLTHEEFKASHLSFVKRNSSTTSPAALFMDDYTSAAPDSMDWRDEGAVTPIKDQGSCGCCWAFTAVAATEAITMIKTGELISLSEQLLLDCVSSIDDNGCNGGVKEDAFQYITDSGITTEAGYPYFGRTTGSCDSSATSTTAATISGYVKVPSNDEASLLQAVANQPVSVTIDASLYSFKFYDSGILGGPCGTGHDHAVTIVGYGADPVDGTKYWLVKNSWGTSWGENGYMRIQRDVVDPQGKCGIAVYPAYPTK